MRCMDVRRLDQVMLFFPLSGSVWSVPDFGWDSSSGRILYNLLKTTGLDFFYFFMVLAASFEKSILYLIVCPSIPEPL